jgi:TolB-like protein/DNA-binding winged helix-turn-helix (wHTH) protein
MDQPAGKTLKIGEWRVNPASGQISREGETARVDARSMRLLICLAEHAGQVVSIDDLLEQVWTGVIVTPDSVYQAVTSLRRLLGDDSKQPTYIATVPRLGYRMVASVTPWMPETSAAASGTSVGRPDSAGGSLFAAGAGLAIALVLGIFVYGRFGSRAAAPAAPVAAHNSVAVLPFLDLTSESMDQEYFADGMTEELIDRLSKNPGLRVAPPTSSFYFKNKKISLFDIAKALDVAYILDGSLRQSGPTLRVATRLVRADNGFVVWSETYDRRSDDVLKAQDDIAGEIAKALERQLPAASLR